MLMRLASSTGRATVVPSAEEAEETAFVVPVASGEADKSLACCAAL